MAFQFIKVRLFLPSLCSLKSSSVTNDTPRSALSLVLQCVVQALRAESVSYVVAPYEADAQLAFLERRGLVDGIITEDSDLLVFGCRNVLFKMDSDGKCCEIRRETIGFGTGAGGRGGEFRFDGWGDREFRHMAVSSVICSFIASQRLVEAQCSPLSPPDPFRLRLPPVHQPNRHQDRPQAASEA
jgi:hypothetical protein